MLCVWYINIPVSMLLFIMHNGNFLNGDIKEKVSYISINYWTYLCFVLLCKLICVLLVRSDYAHFGWKKTICIVWLPFPSDILEVKLFSFLYLLYSSIFSKREFFFLNSIIVTSKLYGTTWKNIQASAKKTHNLKMGESKYTNDYQSVDYTLHPYAWVKKKSSTICVNRLDNAATEPCVVAFWRIAHMRSQCEIVKDNLQKRCLFILKS